MASTELVFNLAPGSRTEVIAIRDLAGPSDRSGLHIFQQAASAPDRSILVSDSMIIAIRGHLGESGNDDTDAVVRQKRDTEVQKTIWDQEPTAPVVREMTTAVDEPTETAAFTNHPTRPRARLHDFNSGDVVGMDTLFGLMHGAGSTTRALELGLRFLAVCYEGVLVFETRGSRLHAISGSGALRDWPGCQQLSIARQGNTQLSRALQSEHCGPYSFNPRDPLDANLMRLTLTKEDQRTALMTVSVHKELRLVMLACTPKYKRHMASKVLRQLRRELGETIERLELDSGVHPTTVRRQSAH